MYATVAVAGGVGIGDVAAVGMGKGAVKDADVDNGCRAVYGVEQGWIGLCCAEGDGMITTVEGAVEVNDGGPGRVYNDILCQAIVAVIAIGAV